jgi:hypothetical protein
MLKKAGPADAGAGDEAAAAALLVEAAAAPLAANESEITRYPDEKATPGATLTTVGSAELRTEVGAGGKLVVVLKKETEVSEVAEHAAHMLVVADDPKDASKKLIGWASEEAFEGKVMGHGHAVVAAGDGGMHAATDAATTHDAHDVHEAHDAGAAAVPKKEH